MFGNDRVSGAPETRYEVSYWTPKRACMIADPVIATPPTTPRLIAPRVIEKLAYSGAYMHAKRQAVDQGARFTVDCEILGG